MPYIFFQGGEKFSKGISVPLPWLRAWG